MVKEKPCKGNPCRRKHQHCSICTKRLYGDQTEEDHDFKCVHANKILDRLYLGAKSNVENFNELKIRQITLIVCMAKELDRPINPSIPWKWIPLFDETAEWAFRELVQGTQILMPYCDEKGDGVAIVHCYMGKSRSVLVTAGVLMVAKHWSAQTALNHIMGIRSIAAPNKGYIAQLLAFETLLEAFRSATNALSLIDFIANFVH